MIRRLYTQGSMESEQIEEIGRQVGRRLRQARERRGQSLEELERVLTIHAHHLDALERGEFDRLPSPLWARGFLITYTEHLGLEGEELVDKVIPLRRSSRPKRYLSRHWRALVATFGAIGVAAAITGAMIFAPYNAVTGSLNEFLHQVAPNTFLGSGTDRIAILGFTGSEAVVEGNVMVASIAQDGFGLLSIPENTLVGMSGQGAVEIGEASTRGEFDLARRSAAQLTGVEVPHYLVVSPEGIKVIVDTMGGVRIDVQNPLNGQARSGGPVLTLRPGPQVLNGDQALVYLQGSDLRSSVERAKRQQVFLRVMFSQALGPAKLLTHPTTLGVMREHVETNMSSAELIQLTGRVKALKKSGAGLDLATIPGRKGAAYPNQKDTQNSYWIPDARRLPGVVKDTVR